jgi:hypothetical protein
MIIIKHNDEEIAYAKNIRVVNDYFLLKVSHTGGNERYLNRPIFSKKYNITVTLIDNKELWQKNQSLIMLKQDLKDNRDYKE